MVTDTRNAGTMTQTDRGLVEPYLDGRPQVSARPINWPAILGAITIALSVQLILSLLAVGIGAAALPASADRAVTTIGIGAVVWACVTGLVAYGIGGYIAGFMSSRVNICGGAAHGLLVWSIAAVFGMTLASLSGAAMIAGIGGGASAGMTGQRSAYMGDASMINNSGIRDNGARNIDGTWNSTPSSRTDTATNDDARRSAAKYTSHLSLIGALGLCMGAVGGAVGGSLGRKTREQAPRSLNPDHT